MILSSFVTLCEGYLGCRPSLALWKRFFNLRAHNARTGAVVPSATEGGNPTYVTDMTDCGSCLVTADKHKCKSPEIVQSCKNCQTTFFYVKSPDQGPDLLNLPEFTLAPPIEKHSGRGSKVSVIATLTLKSPGLPNWRGGAPAD